MTVPLCGEAMVTRRADALGAAEPLDVVARDDAAERVRDDVDALAFFAREDALR